MSRDLTCNESLADDHGGTGNNFSPTQGRFNQAQQLFSTNSAQSLALIREQLLQQQQLQNQQSNHQLAASLLRAQQSLGPNIDALTSNPSSLTDNTLNTQLQLLFQQQSQQQQRQAQLALLSQSNLYGAVSGQLPTNTSTALGNLALPTTTNNVDSQTNRLSHIQQLATALGLQVPATQGVQQNDNSESIISQLLEQIQSQQRQLQNPQPVIANAQSLQQSNLAQTAARNSSSIEQQLISRLLNTNQSVGGTNSAQSAQLLIQQKINEILQSPQILQIARELTEQHVAPTQQNQQFQKQELRQTSSYAADSAQRQQTDLVNQYLQRVAAQCGVTLSAETPSYSGHQTTSQATMPTNVSAPIHPTSIASQLQQQLVDQLTNQDRTAASLQQLQQQLPYEHQQLLQQHLSGNSQLPSRPNFVSQATSFLNNLQNAYILQREAQTPQQLAQDHQNRTTSGASPRILKRSRPSSSTPAAASTNNLHQRTLNDFTIEELKQKQNDLLKSSIQFDGVSSVQHEVILEEYRRIQQVIESKVQNHERNGSNRLNEELLQQEKQSNSYRHSLDQLHATKDQTAQQLAQSNDTRFIANIPTLAAFRQVPGQDIFDHLPKKRVKQEKEINKDLGLQRKQAKSLENLSGQPKKGVQKSGYVSKKFQNGSTNSSVYANHEPINIDNDDFENFAQRQTNNTFRKRGRPRTANKVVGQRLPQTIPLENLHQKPNDSPTRTILHDAVDIFLKPSAPDGSTDRSTTSPANLTRKRVNRKAKNLENEQLLSKINSLAAAVNMTSPKDSDLLSLTDLPSSRLQSPEADLADSKKAKFNLKAADTQLAIEKFREKHPELKEMSDLEIFGIQAIISAIADQDPNQLDVQKNKSIMVDFVANSLSNGPNFWNILHHIPKKMLPNELKVVDQVFNQQHLLDLAKVEMLTKHINDKNANKSTRSRPLFRDYIDANERKNIQLMALHLSFSQRRMDFVKSFIYESTMVRLLNGEYKQLRGDRYPQELFIDEPVAYNRVNKQFGQVPPEYSKFMNSAEVECKLLNQMYRFRSQFFNEARGRPFALPHQKRLSPDEMIVMNMDVTNTLFNVVDSVSTGKPYVSFEQENESLLEDAHPSAEDFHRLAFKTCEPFPFNNESFNEKTSIDEPNTKRTVILKAKQTSSEVEELKQRLQAHLTNNFNELLKIHDAAHKIRCRAIELHRNDINSMLTSIQRSIRDKSGRRCASVEPSMNVPLEVPLYNRRRCRSLDIGVRSRVVNSVGIRYLRYSLASSNDVKEESDKMDIGDEQKETVFGPKEYHEMWEEDGFECLSERFEALLNERQQLIASLIKLTFVDKDARAVIEAACEKNVAVNTAEFKVDGPMSRKHKLKSNITLAQHLRRHPHLYRQQLSRRFKKHRTKPKTQISKLKNKDFNWWYLQMLNGNLDSQLLFDDSNTTNNLTDKQRRLKERSKFLSMCKRMQSESIIAYTPSLYIRDKNFIIKTLSERAFNNELNFRHLKCVALKFYAALDPDRHVQFVKKLEKIEAPRLDTVLKMRNDLTIGYLYELPTYELRSHAQQKHKNSNAIKVTPNPDVFDEMFGGKSKNPYRNPFLHPITTSQFEINSAQLTKYRNRESDSTSAERLHNSINLTTCARALMRLIYHTPKYGEELAIFMSHPAFKVFDSEQGDQNGFPSTVYQVSVTNAVDQKKVSVEKRKMPDFKNNDEAELYFKERQKSIKEKLASILTTAHKHTILSRRCVKTMKKLSGVEKSQNAKISLVKQHYNSLSTRSKSQFVKRFRMDKFNESTQFESTVPLEDNLKAPLVISGFNVSDSTSVDSSLKLPNYIRNDILSPQKVQLSNSDELRSSMRGGKMTRGGRGKRRAGK